MQTKGQMKCRHVWRSGAQSPEMQMKVCGIKRRLNFTNYNSEEGRLTFRFLNDVKLKKNQR